MAVYSVSLMDSGHLPKVSVHSCTLSRSSCYSVLARIWIFFFKKGVIEIFLGSYLQKRGVILSTTKIWQMYIKCAYYMSEHVAVNRRFRTQ